MLLKGTKSNSRTALMLTPPTLSLSLDPSSSLSSLLNSSHLLPLTQIFCVRKFEFDAFYRGVVNIDQPR
jgi:hypothetical protein